MAACTCGLNALSIFTGLIAAVVLGIVLATMYDHLQADDVGHLTPEPQALKHTCAIFRTHSFVSTT